MINGIFYFNTVLIQLWPFKINLNKKLAGFIKNFQRYITFKWGKIKQSGVVFCFFLLFMLRILSSSI